MPGVWVGILNVTSPGLSIVTLPAVLGPNFVLKLTCTVHIGVRGVTGTGETGFGSTMLAITRYLFYNVNKVFSTPTLSLLLQNLRMKYQNSLSSNTITLPTHSVCLMPFEHQHPCTNYQGVLCNTYNIIPLIRVI